ncbi:MAG: peptide chain release factor N(5)-glutamine methyltransferase [Eubacterium sp.]|nr:peptide chain release factor N(5)-glutamine methyltransferase [Eubacterium sp.]
MIYQEAMEWGSHVLGQAGVAEAKLDAWLLLETVCRINRTFYYSHMKETMTLEQQSEYEIAIRKRAERIPLQYITGEQEFMGLNFKVNSNVLVPRQDTETLVEEALKICQPGMEILDLGTGSGCIVISLMKNAHGMTATGSDISKQALLVAKENARLHEVEIEWVRSNLYENISGRFDLIVSNPPYIPQEDILGLMPEVRDFEPVGALDGGVDGLDFYRQIIAQGKDYLNKDGYLYLEIGYDQGPAVTNMMCAAGYRDVAVVRDLAHQERVVKGRI